MWKCERERGGRSVWLKYRVDVGKRDYTKLERFAEAFRKWEKMAEEYLNYESIKNKD